MSQTHNKATVLIADDSTLSRTLIRYMISCFDVKIIEAENGKQTVRQINKHNPNLILMDVSMPPPDGLSILRRLRQDETQGDTPVIIISVEKGECYEEAQEYGVSGYLIKPIKEKELIELVQSVLEKIPPKQNEVYNI